jgi:hypothetical protein
MIRQQTSSQGGKRQQASFSLSPGLAVEREAGTDKMSLLMLIYDFWVGEFVTKVPMGNKGLIANS